MLPTSIHPKPVVNRREVAELSVPAQQRQVPLVLPAALPATTPVAGQAPLDPPVSR